MTTLPTQAGVAPDTRSARAHPRARWLRRLALALCVAPLLGGCAMLGLKGNKPAWSQLTIAASDDMNNNSPVSVDIVFAADDDMVKRVADLSASKWFAGRDDLVGTYPKAIRYRSWEVVPGQRIELSGKPLDGPRVAGAFVFANYQGAGAYRASIERYDGHLVVQLNGKTFSVSTTQ